MNYWAIVTGINQYHNLQPLMYAQQDAISLWRFLGQTVGFAPERCFCLSDVRASTESGLLAAYGQQWRDRISQLCHQHVQPHDLLWVFFSGYGVQFEGQDYLMPIDGDPNHIADTALGVSWLYQQLKLAPTDNIVVVLDINRSQGALAEQHIGRQILELAKDHGIATLLSCQPTEFTHETLALGHGIFTTALLEAMQYHGCVTLGQIATYLSDRLPELCEHHWRPLQHPVALIPRDKQFLMMIPADAVTRLPLTTRADEAMDTGMNEAMDTAGIDEAMDQVPVAMEQVPVAPGSTANDSPNAQSSDQPLSSTDQDAVGNPWWASWGGVRWVLSAALFAIIGVFLGRWLGFPGFEFSPRSEVADSQPRVDPPVAPELPESDTSEANSADPNSTDPNSTDPSGTTDSAPGVVDAPSTTSESTAIASMRPTPEKFAGEATALPDDASLNQLGDGGLPHRPLFARPFPPMATDGAPSAMVMAQGAIADEQFSDALIWLNQVPFGQQTLDYLAIYDQVERELYDQTQRNQAFLAEVKAQVDTSQVASLNQAIFEAQQIPPGQAVYHDAQMAIYDWSRQILTLAQTEAEAGDLGAAIAMADFVPRSQPTVHREAQAAALAWQGRLAYRQMIEQAQKLPEPGQAASFHQAIVQVLEIPEGNPEFELAKTLTQQWSAEILTIAQARAAQGRVQDAIAAAQLIPANTEAYASAQALINQWQQP